MLNRARYAPLTELWQAPIPNLRNQRQAATGALVISSTFLLDDGTPLIDIREWIKTPLYEGPTRRGIRLPLAFALSLTQALAEACGASVEVGASPKPQQLGGEGCVAALAREQCTAGPSGAAPAVDLDPASLGGSLPPAPPQAGADS